MRERERDKDGWGREKGREEEGQEEEEDAQQTRNVKRSCVREMFAPLLSFFPGQTSSWPPFLRPLLFSGWLRLFVFSGRLCPQFAPPPPPPSPPPPPPCLPTHIVCDRRTEREHKIKVTSENEFAPPEETTMLIFLLLLSSAQRSFESWHDARGEGGSLYDYFFIAVSRSNFS